MHTLCALYTHRDCALQRILTSNQANGKSTVNVVVVPKTGSLATFAARWFDIKRSVGRLRVAIIIMHSLFASSHFVHM